MAASPQTSHLSDLTQAGKEDYLRPSERIGLDCGVHVTFVGTTQHRRLALLPLLKLILSIHTCQPNA